MREPIVRLVYERTSPPGVDAGVEPLIAVCATEDEADRIREASSARCRYASWEEHALQGAAGRTASLADGEMTHVVLLGTVDADPDDYGRYRRLRQPERRRTACSRRALSHRTV